MFKYIFLSVIAFVLAALAAAELFTYRKNRGAGWETDYYRGRLIRRCVIMAMLEAIVLSSLLADFVNVRLEGPGWKLIYYFACLILVFMVFILILKDVAETVKFSTKKYSEITLRSFQKTEGDETKTRDEENAPGDGGKST